MGEFRDFLRYEPMTKKDIDELKSEIPLYVMCVLFLSTVCLAGWHFGKEQKFRQGIKDQVVQCISGRSRARGVTPYQQVLDGVDSCLDDRLSEDELDELLVELSGEDLVDCLADRLDAFLRANLSGKALNTNGLVGDPVGSIENCLPKLGSRRERILSNYGPEIRKKLEAKGWNMEEVSRRFAVLNDTGLID